MRLTFLLILLASTRPAAALPTMVRLGYTNCAACHIAPQGAGLLNLYGRGIDEAQSLRAGEYAESAPGRIIQDLRSVTQDQISTSTGKPVTNFFRTRLIYRNSTELVHGLRFSAGVAIENASAPRPALRYEPSITPAPVYRSQAVTLRGYITTALLSYRATKNVEVAAGRDQLPTGVNIADLSAFVRSRNRLGYYDSPVQVKLFWWGKRHQITPYVFGPSGNEQAGSAESGAGSLAEFDLLGNGRTVVGLNVLRADSRMTRRTLLAPHVRLGFGSWGILAEHDITDRSYQVGAVRQFRQNASYSQLFWAAREWLVLSAIGERLKVGGPFHEDLLAGRFEMAARLSSNVTLTSGVRLQRNLVNGQTGPALTLQLALKPVFKPLWKTY